MPTDFDENGFTGYRGNQGKQVTESAIVRIIKFSVRPIH